VNASRHRHPVSGNELEQELEPQLGADSTKLCRNTQHPSQKQGDPRDVWSHGSSRWSRFSLLLKQLASKAKLICAAHAPNNSYRGGD
jgi:hypothetical protein